MFNKINKKQAKQDQKDEQEFIKAYEKICQEHCCQLRPKFIYTPNGITAQLEAFKNPELIRLKQERERNEEHAKAKEEWGELKKEAE